MRLPAFKGVAAPKKAYCLAPGKDFAVSLSGFAWGKPRVIPKIRQAHNKSYMFGVSALSRLDVSVRTSKVALDGR